MINLLLMKAQMVRGRLLLGYAFFFSYASTQNIKLYVELVTAFKTL